MALLCVAAAVARGQMPFYTDDADVTAKGVIHVESFDEYDWLQAERAPHLRQNTLNGKVNYGFDHGLELDLDAPLITIYNTGATTPRQPFGIGDTEFGVKWKFHNADSVSSGPALAAVLYIEVPTGNPATSIGSGLTDTWLYLVAQRDLPNQFTVHFNVGYLVTGNPATGVIGLTAHGRVTTLNASLTRQFGAKWNLGAEVAGAIASAIAKDHAQLQGMLGGSYNVRENFALTLGVLGGRFAASPRAGVQMGFALDR